MYIVYCILYMVYCILYIVYCILYIVYRLKTKLIPSWTTGISRTIRNLKQYFYPMLLMSAFERYLIVSYFYQISFE